VAAVSNRLLVLVLAMPARILLAQSVGEALPPWTPGTVDIHQISTGRGNAAFLILPDGTTLLVDAGAAGDGVPETDPHPDASRSPGAWIARYVRRRLPASVDSLDYALITHFHADHFGQVVGSSPFDRTGSYRLTGITEVAETLPIRVLLDRGWPDYSYPVPLTDSTITNYRKFIATRAKSGMTVERFTPGSASQIRLRRNPERYAGFEIRNIIANGEVWTGSGSQTRRLFPPPETLSPADRPSENMCSLGFRLQYGRFRYFSGGDLPGAADPGFPAWHTVEPMIASIVGPVDVQVVNQHGSMGEESEAFLAALRSTVLIIPSWAPSHPAPDVLKRIVNSRLAPNPRYVFVTDLREAAKIVIGQRASQLPPSGHIVVRVEPGGAHYRVFVLDNYSESDTVLSAKGPFETN
jgi:beta-lactamase superfamily II metal-dependent hydrolase